MATPARWIVDRVKCHLEDDEPQLQWQTLRGGHYRILEYKCDKASRNEVETNGEHLPPGDAAGFPNDMTEFYPKPTHGTAFKTVMEESRILDQFMGIVHKKLELDKQYLAELMELKKSWNSEWHDTGVWSLIAPFLKYLDDEISHRIAATEDALRRYQKVPQSRFFSGGSETNFDPLELPGCLEDAFATCKSHEVANANRETAILQNWYVNHGVDYHLLSSKRPVPLPAGDIAHRKAISRQHQLVERVDTWYVDGLPTVLERHQQRAEDIKALIHGCLGCYSILASESSSSCSVAIHDTNAFQSTVFIAPRHDEMERERQHPLLEKLNYCNYYYWDGGEAKPLFGLGPGETLKLINRMLYSPRVDWSRLLPRRHSASAALRAFELEKAALTNSDVLSIMMTEHPDDGQHPLLLLKFAFWSEAPFLPISSEHLKQYRNSSSRRKIRLLFELIDSTMRAEVMALVYRLLAALISQVEVFWACEYAAILLAHTPEAGLLLYELWCQWDFASDCPLPDGVERVWNAEGRKEELLWKKTGDPYSASAPVTPPVSGITRTLTQLRVTRGPRQTTNFTV